MSRTIFYGICGIGMGHTYRQLPIIDDLAKRHDIALFAYDASYVFYREHFRDNKRVTIVPVAVPFYAGNEHGLDFMATVEHNNNAQDFFKINAIASEFINTKFGKPDLVITDYEPVSAQLAYAYNAPLVTIDQQSKLLVAQVPEDINGFRYNDELMRLRMFFPKAAARIATSFFKVTEVENPTEQVSIYPAIVKDSIVQLKRRPKSGSKHKILIYFSAQQQLKQTVNEVLAICANVGQAAEFHIFFPRSSVQRSSQPSSNVYVYPHGNEQFMQVISECHGVVTTAGHGLLSEAMYLGIPVYALPLDIYEQQLNAYEVAKYGFGFASERLELESLEQFLRELPLFTAAIAQDTTVLQRGPGQGQILSFLEETFLK
ncbi:hypothetical protein KBC79_00120 [Candidatus Woesebacteria bacterium]|nr:hypothetical protein [Candidatus Woesebacteria bacterium]